MSDSETTFAPPPSTLSSVYLPDIIKGQPSPAGSYTLLTVNKVPERAFRLISQAVTVLEPRYMIVHVGNIASIRDVGPTVERYKPDILFSASMWSQMEVVQIQDAARGVKPDILLHAIPEGLQAEKGPDAVVEYLVQVIPTLLQEHKGQVAEGKVN